jgi:hypothetical protein
LGDELLGVFDSDRQDGVEEIDEPLSVGGGFEVEIDAIILCGHF